MYSGNPQDNFAIIDIAQTLERIRLLLRTDSGRAKVNKMIRTKWLGNKK